MLINADIGSRIKELRLKLNLSQREFAEGLNISVRSLSNYENNSTSIPYETLVKIVTTYEGNLGWLATGEKNYPQFNFLNSSDLVKEYEALKTNYDKLKIKCFDLIEENTLLKEKLKEHNLL